jgi:hypothetical protein
MIGVLERSGESFQAAIIARQNDDRARAIAAAAGAARRPEIT